MMGLEVSVYGSLKSDIFIQKSFRIQLNNLSIIWQIEQVGISTIQFEVAQIHFLSDVFIAVTIVFT